MPISLVTVVINSIQHLYMKTYNNIILFNFDTYLQVQYIFEQAVLKPHQICAALSLCNQIPALDTNSRNIPTALQKLANTSSKSSGEREKVDTVFQRQKMWTALNGVLKPTADVKKIYGLSGQLRNGSDTVTILQLADIHIDQFYSEVGPSLIPNAP